jgi:molecular chaperone HscB
MHILEQQYPENYFSLLGLPISFDIDKDLLIKNYHEIQRSIHPDNFANAGDRERRLSVQKAAQINDALNSLKNPLPRAIYLLSLFAIELSDNKHVAPEFLMEQMELREALSQVNDKTDPFAELDVLINNVNTRIEHSISQLSQLFESLLVAYSTQETESEKNKFQQEQLELITADVLKMQYLNRLQEECLNKEEDLAEQY